MEWLFPAAVFLWGVYLVWKVDKLEDEVKELRSIPFRLDHQRDAVNALEQRLDQLKQCLDQLDAIVNPPPTPAQLDAIGRSLQLIDEQTAEEQKRADLTRP